jgi:hypothetical protein
METEDDIKYEVVDTDTIKLPTTKLKTDFNENLMAEERVLQYIKENNPKLFILTPCFGGTCYINYLVCLMKTMELFNRFQFPVQVEFCRNDSLVPRARNNLIARAMNDPAMTHMIFIDNDISWEPLEILKLILSDKDVIGGIYPLKRYNWQTILKDEGNPYNTNVIQNIINRKENSHLKNFLSDELMVRSNMVKYNVNYLTNTLEIKNNLAKVRHVASGFMMIKRTVIEEMFKAYPETKYVDDVNFLIGKENEHAFALFDCRVEDGHYFSEDWLFCKRWMDTGGEVFADVTVNLTHTGLEDYFGCYISSIVS